MRKGPVLDIKEIADDKLHKVFISSKSNKSSRYDNISSNIIGKALFNEAFLIIKTYLIFP